MALYRATFAFIFTLLTAHAGPSNKKSDICEEYLLFSKSPKPKASAAFIFEGQLSLTSSHHDS
jgi:hypothetical protein